MVQVNTDEVFERGHAIDEDEVSVAGVDEQEVDRGS